MASVRTERCSASGVDVRVCECIKHRLERERAKSKRVRLREPSKCTSCGLAKPSVEKRKVPGRTTEVLCCKDCQDRKQADQDERDRRKDWVGWAKNATL